MARWHDAARAWQRYRAQQGADARLGLRREARARFEDGQYAAALALLDALPEAARDDEWRYLAGVCELRAGDAAAGRKLLQALAAKDGEDRPNGAPWPLLARLTLADAAAQALIARDGEAAR